MSAALAAEAAPATLAQRGFVRRLLGRPLALLALAWIVAIVLGALFAPQLAPHDPLDQDLTLIKQWPGAGHWLGTDALGRDVLSRLLFGAGATLVGVVQAVLVVALLGIGLGLSAGYFGGWWDRLVDQYASLVQSLPNILILLVVLSLFGQAMLPAMVTLGVLGSAGVARVLRSVTLAVREELYIAAARICGLSDFYIVSRHVLPRVAGTVIVQLSLFAAIAVLVQTGISFLGLGVAPPAPTWGGMIFDASASLNDFPWLLVPSGFTVALTILAFGLLGDSLRDTAVESWAQGGQRARATAAAPAPIADAPAGAVLSLRDLRITSGSGPTERTLVHELALDLMPGETLGIVGESGSGKTLSILALMGLLPPGTRVASGRALIAGRTISLTDEAALAALRGHGLGMIFQEPMAALDPCFTVGHHLAEVVRLQSRQGRPGRAEVQRRVVELLEQVKIPNPEDVARRYPHQISGGMAQRVGIARALAGAPKILFADEPTTALDVTVQAEILELLRSASRQREMAVVLVTHDWGVVADLCDRALVLRHGRVLEAASVLDLFQRPAHPYTRALLLANPHGAAPGQTLPTVEETMARALQAGAGAEAAR